MGATRTSPSGERALSETARGGDQEAWRQTVEALRAPRRPARPEGRHVVTGPLTRSGPPPGPPAP